MTLIDDICQEKREEEDLPALRQRLEDYIEKHGGRPITAIRNNTNDTGTSRLQITRKKKRGKKNNSIDILSEKQATSHTIKHGRD